MGDEHDRLREAIRLKKAEAAAKGITGHDVMRWVATELYDELEAYLADQVMRAESERIWATLMPPNDNPTGDEAGGAISDDTTIRTISPERPTTSKQRKGFNANST
jgi:hypothetical protein